MHTMNHAVTLRRFCGIHLLISTGNSISVMTCKPVWFQIISDYICFLLYLTTLFVVIKWYSLDGGCVKFEYGAFWSDSVRENPKYWERNNVLLPVYSAQVPQGPAWDWNQASALELMLCRWDRTEQMGNAYQTRKGKRPLVREIGVVRRTILKWVLRKRGMRMWSGYSWLRAMTSQ